MLVLLAGCGRDDEGTSNEELAIEPQLDFISARFARNASPSSSIDTIAVTFRYRDGDSNIGLTTDDQDVPYQSYNFFLENGSVLTPIPGRRVNVPYDMTIMTFVVVTPGAATGKLATIESREKPAFSSLPPYLYPYSCLYYQAGGVLVAASDKRILDGSHVITDSLTMEGAKFYLLHSTDNTFYSERNENALNLYIDFLVEQNDGTFTEFDFTRDLPTKVCAQSFDTRLPLLSALTPGRHRDQVFDFNIISDKEGEITYTMISSGFRDLFINKNLKLRVSLKDRSLYESNTIETSVFRVQ
jgi:hypothetical protein